MSQLEVRNYGFILKKGSITACCTYSEYMVARSPLGPLDSVTLGALKQPQSLKFTFIKDIVAVVVVVVVEVVAEVVVVVVVEEVVVVDVVVEEVVVVVVVVEEEVVVVDVVVVAGGDEN